MTAVKKRVFVVDDEPLIRGLIRDVLDAQGYEVQEAEDCQTGIRGFQKHRPHLAILDHVLPDGTGLELLRVFRDMDAEVPLILMTGYGNAEIEKQALAAGAIQFLKKPFELDSFLQAIEQALASSPLEERRGTSNSSE